MTILGLPPHPPCNCHDCTWLRASLLDRTFLPRFQPAEKKKCLVNHILRWFCADCGETFPANEELRSHEPPRIAENVRKVPPDPAEDEVENKIATIVMCWSNRDDLILELRALVALAKKSKLRAVDLAVKNEKEMRNEK